MKSQPSIDQFAAIAQSHSPTHRGQGLVEPKAAPVPDLEFALAPVEGEPTPVPKRLSTEAELRLELARQRELYRPFLADLAPKVASARHRIAVDRFVVDGAEVRLPDYGGPVGRAVKTYETSVELPALDPDQAVFLTCSGADYKATVLVNGVPAGSHEGFFSPFEFDVTELVVAGSNRLAIRVENDFIYMGNAFPGEASIEGDKLYAATGLGWDDPVLGWHHCPPGMGIYGQVAFEVRPTVHVADVFVRPLPDEAAAELWVEVHHCGYDDRPASFNVSVFGQNFGAMVIDKLKVEPTALLTVGRGDSLTEAREIADGRLGAAIGLKVRHGRNLFKVRLELPNFRAWTLETPWLYQVQVTYGDDTATSQFGMRSFRQDTESLPKGRFFFNGQPLKLRGANTMGFEQQAVLRKDFDQLVDDILLAKIAGMNFLRFTQRPVQAEVYDLCDRLGLLTQTDLPLFGCMRRFAFAEGVRQAEEMERLVRGHACNVVVSYINEPFPNARNQPHRHLERPELEAFFGACDAVIRLNHPDQVIKHVDGDYDPPGTGMPDNHCYPLWYNGHGLDIGRLHRGDWLAVQPGWVYGCGEFGAEGLDFPEVMRGFYPAEWTREPFNPGHIVGAQTWPFHRMFYDTPDTMEEWVEASQTHQAFATKVMTEAFRRNNDLVSIAIHLFIDAWPSGWMKTIMDFQRRPKKAYFAYRDALAPVLLSLRTDKLRVFAGEAARIESWVANDTPLPLAGELTYELLRGGRVVARGVSPLRLAAVTSAPQGWVTFTAPDVTERETLKLRVLSAGTWGELELEVFPKVEPLEPNHAVVWAGQDVTLAELVHEGKTVILEWLAPGRYQLAGLEVDVKACGMLPLHFVSRATGHPAVAEFKANDFRWWYESALDRVSPLLHATFTAPDMTPVLVSGNVNASGLWDQALACAEVAVGSGRLVICQLPVSARQDVPVARLFARSLANIPSGQGDSR